MAAYFALPRPGRHGPRAAARPRRPPDARAEGQLLGPALHVVHYGVSRETSASTTTRCSRSRSEHRPKLIVCGGSAYPRTVEARDVPRDRRRGRRAAHVRHGPLRRARRRGPAPEPGRATATSSPRRRTRRSPARARASSSAAPSTPQAIDRAVFPGLQGGPLEHAIAAKATCFGIAATDGVPRLLSGRCARTPTRSPPSSIARRARRPHRRHRHAPRPARPARHPSWTGKDAEERLARGRHHREPQHGAVRRAPADGRLGRPVRHAGGDDARLRRGRLPRGRRGHLRRARPRRGPRRARGRAATRSASAARSTPGFARATRCTTTSMTA